MSAPPLAILSNITACAAIAATASAKGLPNQVIAVSSRQALDSLFSNRTARSPFPGRLIGFVTDVIVPARYLAATLLTPVNFHPGPPEYPGLRAIEFALREGVTSYGVTAHAMTLPVDSGLIIGVNRFEARGGDEDGLRYETWRAAYSLLMHLLPALAAERPLQRIEAEWSTRVCSDAAWRALQTREARTDS
ncbi:formyltransferase family protein [Nisaea sediminum]|uniref:formyltransferase family protein n=1 Tax=Nisaea sediminum TaxID=2775867 RepID=UPI00186710F9|nr:formyltransferase family protein [Nisaea sediminum]